MQPTIRSFDLAHLAHVELLTPKPEESLRFFVDTFGMTESGRRAKFYSLTRAGRKQLRIEVGNWERLAAAITAVSRLREA